MTEENPASGTPSLIKVNSEYDFYICSSLVTNLQFDNCKMNLVMSSGSKLWNVLMMAGYAPDKSTGDVAADQYHHYKVSTVFISSDYLQTKTQLAKDRC
jgi:hypothetical protein